MPYIGDTLAITADGGWNNNQNFDQIPINSVVDVDNINTHNGGREPRGGSDVINQEAIQYGILKWSSIISVEANSWVSVAYGNGVFVAVAGTGTNRVMRSTDLGLTWSPVAITTEWTSIAYGNGVFVAVSSAGTNRVMRSTDLGLTWSAIAAAEANQWISVAYGNGVFIAVSPDGTNRVMRSTDLGLTWSPIAAAEANEWFSVAYGNDVFVAVASTGTNRVMRSTNYGTSWSPIAAAEANSWRSVAYGGGVFVSVSYDGTNRIMRSTNLGLTWNAIAAPGANNWYSAAYGNGVFIAVATTTTTYPVIYSIDLGLTWSLLVSEGSSFYNTTFGNGVFISVGYGGTYQVMRIILSQNTEGIYQFIPPGGTITPNYFVDESGNFFVDERGNFFVSESASFLIGTQDGSIYKNFTTLLKSGLTPNQEFSFEKYYNEVIISNGVDTPQVWDGSTTYTWDLGSPKMCTAVLGSGAGNVDDGTHYYKVTFVTASGESTPGQVSAAVVVVNKTINGKVELTNIPLGLSASTARKIYRTKVASSTLYYLLTTLSDNTTTVYTDNTADASLGAAPPTTSLAFLPTDWQTNKPKYFIAHERGTQHRLWAFGVNGYLDNMYASANEEADFSNANVIVMKILTDRITGAVDFGGNLIPYSRNRAFIINDIPLDIAYWGHDGALWEGGAAHHKLIVKSPSDVAVMSLDGNIYSISAAQRYGDVEIASLTRPSYIHKWIEDNVDLLQIDKFWGGFDHKLRALKFFVVRKGYTYPDCCLVYFIDKPPVQAWSKHTFNIKHLCGANVYSSESAITLYTGSDNGYIHALETDSMRDAGTIYQSTYTMPPLSLGNPRAEKRFDKFWLVQKPLGTEGLAVDIEIDDRALPQQGVVMTGAGDILQNFAVDVGASGKRIQPKITSSDGNKYFIGSHLIDFQNLGSA